METKIPGLKVGHCEITENCRVVQGGDLDAFEEAACRLRGEYLRNIKNWPQGKGASYHLVLTVDYPRK